MKYLCVFTTSMRLDVSPNEDHVRKLAIYGAERVGTGSFPCSKRYPFCKRIILNGILYPGFPRKWSSK